MSISFKSANADLFQSGAEAWVNPVNCVGVMGKGLALVFRQRFPDNLRQYQQACLERGLRPGHFLAVENHGAGPAFILNLATKDRWQDPSELEWVAQGARRMRIWAEEKGVAWVACPALGSGEGRLPWAQVKAELIIAFGNSPVNFEVYEPRGISPKPLLETQDRGMQSLPSSVALQTVVPRKISFRSR